MSSASKFAATSARATIVIRREFDISEGDAFNQVLVQRAKRRLEALDFFTSVDISTAPGSEPDQVILVVDVVEKSTGEFSIGGGYTTGGETAGPSIEGSITERNFLGPRPVHPLLGGRRQELARLPAVVHRAVFPRAAASPPASTSTASRAPTTTTRARSPAAPYASACRSRRLVDADRVQSCRRKNTTSTTDCDVNGDGIARPEQVQRLASPSSNGVASSPWIKSSVSGTLLYNTIDDVNNPHSGIYAQVDRRSRRPRRRRQVRQGNGAGPLLSYAVGGIRHRRPADRRRRPYRRFRRTTGCALSTCSRAATASFAASSSTASARSTPTPASSWAARATCMPAPKPSSRCRSFRKASACGRACLPMRRRCSATILRAVPARST